MAVAEGTLIAGRYRLTSRLASGGSGVIWAAQDVNLGVAVAARQVELDPGATPEERRRALTHARAECRHAVGLRSHPNVGTVHDVAEHTDGRPWMITDLMPGRSLADILNASGPIDVPTARTIAVAVLSALTAAHAEGIVHRDLNPSTILVADDGRVLLTGFGIARRADDAQMTGPGVPVGSMPYTAPERFNGVTTPACDLFALGVTLYQALEGGQSPFQRDSVASIINAVGTFTPPPPVNAGDLEPLLRFLLTKDHTARITAAAALAMVQGGQAMQGMQAMQGQAMQGMQADLGGTSPSVAPGGSVPWHAGARTTTPMGNANLWPPPPVVGTRIPKAPRHPRLEVCWRFIVPSLLMAAILVLTELPVAAVTGTYSDVTPGGESGQFGRSMYDLLSPLSNYDGGISPFFSMVIILMGTVLTTAALAVHSPRTALGDRTLIYFGYLGPPIAIAGFARQLSMVTVHSARLFPVHYSDWWGEQTVSLGLGAWFFYAVLVAMGVFYVFRDIAVCREAGQRWPIGRRTSSSTL